MLTTGFIIKDYPLAKAQQLVNLYHRHNIQPQGHKFTLALFRDNQADSFYIDDQDYSNAALQSKGSWIAMSITLPG